MNTGAFYGTVRKYGDLTFGISTSSSRDEAADSYSDIELSVVSDSDDSNSSIDFHEPGLCKNSQELRDVLTSSFSSTDCVGVTPTTRKYSFTAEEKNIGERNTNTLQPYDVTENLLNMIVLQTNNYAADSTDSVTVTRRSLSTLQ